MKFDGGGIGGRAGRGGCWGGCGSFAHLGGATIKFFLASLQERLAFLQLGLELLEIVGCHGAGRRLGWDSIGEACVH